MPSGEAVNSVADLSRSYLGDLTDLPRASLHHLSERLDKIGRPKRRRARGVGAKD